MTLRFVSRLRPGVLSRTPGRSRLRVLLLPLLLALDVVCAVWAWSIFSEGLWLLGAVVVPVVVGINVAAVSVRATALRWMLPMLAFLVAFAVAPIVYTAYVAFTNYNGVHALTQQQAYAALERQTYSPDDAPKYSWAAYRAPDGAFALYLIPENGRGPDRFTRQDGRSQNARPGVAPFASADDDGFPLRIEGFTRLNPIEKVQSIDAISSAHYGQRPLIYRAVSAATVTTLRNQYRIHTDGSVEDARSGTVYRPSSEGFFTSVDGKRIQPAFQTFVGLGNVARLVVDPGIRGPFLQILLWTIVFALVGVALQFALALLYAVVLNSRYIRPRFARVVRSVLLLPYVIPAYLMVLTWASLFNRQTGLIPSALSAAFGLDPSWIGTPTGARIAMLIVGIWLGFPYFLLINTGALQSIPDDLIEASAVDGAGPWRRFGSIVFPLLMRTVAPLVVLAFAFAFNNFYVAYLLFGGGPVLPDTQVPAGATDLLISLTYKISFGSSGADNDYALAAVVTSLIFLALTPIVLSQLRFYTRWRKDD